MDHIALIDAKLKKKQYFSLSRLIEKDDSLKEAFAQYYIHADLRTLQAMSHVLDKSKNRKIYLLEEVHQQLVEQLEMSNNVAFRRNTFRYFSDVPVDDDISGLLYDLGLNAVLSPDEPIAIRAFAMTTCVNIAKKYSTLLPELKDAIIFCSRTESPGIQVRCRRHMKEINAWME